MQFERKSNTDRNKPAKPMQYQYNYALQNRKLAKLNARPMATVVSIEASVGMGFAHAQRATNTCQRTRPFVTVRVD